MSRHTLIALLLPWVAAACVAHSAEKPMVKPTHETALVDVLPETNESTLPDGRSTPKLMRVPYVSALTKKERDYFVYLPAGYESEAQRHWPVMLFLHGDGERGNAKEELERLLKNGPLHEAWKARRDLPFIIVAPQLPEHQTIKDLGHEVDVTSHFPGGNFGIQRAPHNIDDTWSANGPPRGWYLFENEVLQILSTVERTYHVDAKRVYLTGLSYGGYGTWHFAERFPERFAAFAPICGAGNENEVEALAKAQTPVWAFHGGRDSVVLAEWQLKTIQALSAAGHKSLMFTVHEDVAHNVWERVYGGWDLYLWLLKQTRASER